MEIDRMDVTPTLSFKICEKTEMKVSDFFVKF